MRDDKPVDTWRDWYLDRDAQVYLGDIKTPEEADDWRFRLLEEMEHIRSQLANCDDDAPYHWKRNAKMALRYKAFSVQKLQDLRAALKKEQNRAISRTRDELLIKKLRAVVGEAVFLQCVRDTDAELAA